MEAKVPGNPAEKRTWQISESSRNSLMVSADAAIPQNEKNFLLNKKYETDPESHFAQYLLALVSRQAEWDPLYNKNWV